MHYGYLKEYLEALIKSDKKSLTQKLGKATEELGELASVILPYDSVYGSTHKFTDRGKVLEECVDVILCVESIIISLDFPEDDINEMVKNKIYKWGERQKREERVKDNPIPFEIHITVELQKDDLIHDFKHHCEEAGVKPIILELQTKNEGNIQDVMTSSSHFGNNSSAYEELLRISNYLKLSGYKVVRGKIETVPWHPMAPCNPNDEMPKNCYFESHLAISCDDSKRELLEKLVSSHGGHLSRNIYKKIHNDTYIIMCTLRSDCMIYSQFDLKVKELKEKLKDHYFYLDKEIIEFAIYDTNKSWDARWIDES